MFESDLDRGVGTIPPALDELEPGPVLAALLSAVDVAGLSGRDRIVVLRAHQRLTSHYQARLYEDMASVTDYMAEIDDNPQFASEAAAAEIRVALRLTRRAADAEVGFALELQQRLPLVWRVLADGGIDLRRAKAIAYGVGHLDGDTAREVVGRIIDDAPGLTTGQLTARIRRLCIKTDPQQATERYRHAVEERRVVSQPTEAGTANLFALDLPPDRVAAIADRINQLARSLRTAGEPRTMDQLRADVFLDVLEGAGHTQAAGRGVIDIRVDLATLCRLAETPGELGGYGPVIADIARQVAEQRDSQWRVTVTDPDTGQTVHNGTTRRRPTNPQRREVETRNPTCVFPGCRTPATGCDLDHRIPYRQDGPTSVENLAPRCRHDHRIRHQTGWTHQPLPGGDHLWTTRLGHTYTTSGKPP